jgi:hypothetical protein
MQRLLASAGVDPDVPRSAWLPALAVLVGVAGAVLTVDETGYSGSHHAVVSVVASI